MRGRVRGGGWGWRKHRHVVCKWGTTSGFRPQFRRHGVARTSPPGGRWCALTRLSRVLRATWCLCRGAFRDAGLEKIIRFMQDNVTSELITSR